MVDPEQTEPGVDEQQVERLKAAVTAAGGRAAVAKRAEMHVGTLNNYLAGREMKLAVAVTIAKACGVSLEFLATGKEVNDQIVNIQMFQNEIWSAPAHFYSLLWAIRIGREYYDKMSLKPSLGELMEWISPVYIGQMSFPDKQVEMKTPDDGSA